MGTGYPVASVERKNINDCLSKFLKAGIDSIANSSHHLEGIAENQN